MGCCNSMPIDTPRSLQSTPSDPATIDTTTIDTTTATGPSRRQRRTVVDFGHTRHWQTGATEQRLTLERLYAKREAFWDTAPAYEGRAEIWQALRLACDESTDMQLSMAILDSVGLTVPTGRITDGAYDERGARYLVPQYCLSLPDNLVASNGAQHAADKRTSMDSGQSMDIQTAVSVDNNHGGSHAALAASSPKSLGTVDSEAGGLAVCSSSAASSSQFGLAAAAHRLTLRVSSAKDVCLLVSRAATVAQIESQLRAAGHVSAESD
ncbi:hypothetical protein FB639_004612, partial [Coemansia asiatica]